MRGYYSKTSAGRVEIQARIHPLSRTARNLLLIIDGTKPAEEWMTMLAGATAADLSALIDAGLVAPLRSGERAQAMPSTTLGYSDLYDSLNGLLREQLGLFRGYKFSLVVEKAASHAELVEVARRFIEEVRELRGDTAAELVTRALGFVR
ncbi:MAG: hypothetical protein RJA44_1287 [Pseudomonadota bacterium]